MDDSTVPTPDAARHQWLLTKYSIPDMGDHTRAGGYLSQILERLATTRVLSVEDKQFLRDFLENSGWTKEPPPPKLPQWVIDGTASRYQEALRRLTV